MIHYTDERVTLHHGDCLDVLRELPDNSVDAVVCDPPYGLANTTAAQVADTLVRWVNGERDYIPAGSGFMGRSWDAFVPPVAVWDECYRVLKPGGHVLAFAGARTHDLMGLGIRLAGFDIRDSLVWLQGGGFPKSLDVGKALDKAAGSVREVVATERSPFRMADPRMGDVLESTQSGDTRKVDADGYIIREITAPATDLARQWQGWGTALKPAQEPIVVARKPLGGSVNVVATVEHSLRQAGVSGDIKWTNAPASGAGNERPTTSSGATAQRPPEATSARRASSSETEPTAPPIRRCTASQPDAGPETTLSEPARNDGSTPASCETPSSPHTDPSASAAVKRRISSSPLTTSKAGAEFTAEQSAAMSTETSASVGSLPVTASFAGTATGLSASQARVRIDQLADGTFVWPDDLPRFAAVGSTVAANVTAWGTGALNIDATRVQTDEALGRTNHTTSAFIDSANGSRAAHARTVTLDNSAGKGRWPTNVVLTHAYDCGTVDQPGPCVESCPVRELDTQSGVTADRPHLRNAPKAAGILGAFAGDDGERMGHADSGGASRFFPTFRYEAKAPTIQRPRVQRDDGTWEAHSTVKPLDLMRWLVRLVVPPGGTCLEPFAGSGTTAEACVIEGMHCIAIEREADYLPLIVARLSKPIELDLFGGVA